MNENYYRNITRFFTRKCDDRHAEKIEFESSLPLSALSATGKIEYFPDAYIGIAHDGMFRFGILESRRLTACTRVRIDSDVSLTTRSRAHISDPARGDKVFAGTA